MNEVNKQRKRNRHIRDATDINRQHADELKHEGIARRKRSRVQKVSEVLENRQIDYGKHMAWLRR